MKEMYRSEHIKTNLMQNYNKVYNALKLIKSQTINNLFVNLFSRIREKLAYLS